MPKEFVDWLVGQSAMGDPRVIDRLAGEIDRHLAEHRGDKAEERQRVAREFSEKAPLTSLSNDMLAVIQP